MLTRSPGDLVALACRLARLHGFDMVVADRGLSDAELDRFDPDLRLTVIAAADTPAGTASRWFERRVPWRGTTSPVGADILSRSVLLGHMGTDTAASDERLRSLMDDAPVAIVSDGSNPKSAGHGGADPADLLRTWGNVVTFAGRHSDPSAPIRLAISDRLVGDGADRAPADFRVVAIMTAYNEEDIVGPSIERLHAQGIGVYLIDNWSSDRTFEIAGQYLGRGLIGLERFPDAPSPTFDLAKILRRVEQVAAMSDADWIIHHDVDERRHAPWPHLSIRDGLWTVQVSGFNAVDHTVLEFHPVDDVFGPGTDFEAYFRHFAFGPHAGHRIQIRAWRSTRGQRVDLASSGGHEVRFARRRVFPYKFLLKHYPIRSQGHGERKILVERKARWNAAERDRGWHLHYDGIKSGHRFLHRPEELMEFSPGSTEREQLIPLISGIGLTPDVPPRWATRHAVLWRAYRALTEVADSRRWRGVRDSRLLRAPMVRDALRALKRRLLGGVQ